MRQNLWVCLLLRRVEKLSNLKRFINFLVSISNDCATKNWMIPLFTPQLMNRGNFSNQDNKYYLKINEFFQLAKLRSKVFVIDLSMLDREFLNKAKHGLHQQTNEVHYPIGRLFRNIMSLLVFLKKLFSCSSTSIRSVAVLFSSDACSA